MPSDKSLHDRCEALALAIAGDINADWIKYAKDIDALARDFARERVRACYEVLPQHNDYEWYALTELNLSWRDDYHKTKDEAVMALDCLVADVVDAEGT